MDTLRRLHPFLFVVVPVLNVSARNPGGAALGDVMALALAMCAGWAVVYAAVMLLLRKRESQEVVPLLVLLALVLFYAYPAFRAAYNQSRDDPARLLVAGAVSLALIAAAAAGIAWLARRPPLLYRANKFLGVMGVLLVAFLGARIVSDQLRARAQLKNSALARRLGEPVLVKNNRAGDTTGGPDIYIVILDEYANSRVLRDRFGFDNRVFEDSLRRLGFTIPSQARSNYAHTLLSLPSLLNFSYLTDLTKELGPRQTDPTIPNYLVENNRTVAFLKNRGYRFAFFPSQWWISTNRNSQANSQFKAWNGLHLAREATRSDLRRAFISRTPLTLLQRGDRYDADHVTRTLGGIAKSREDGAPTFVLAHVLSPHYPYVFDPECRPHRRRPTRRWGQGREEDYLEQLQCLNRLLLGTVTQLLQGPNSDPVILLVGDHGTNSLGYNYVPSAEAVSSEQAMERFGAFAALRLPPGAGSTVPDTISLVNLIPVVFNSVFDAGLPLSPDSLYMSLEKTPYQFAPVDPHALAVRHR